MTALDSFYSRYFGGRWSSLKEALEKPERKVRYPNPWTLSPQTLSEELGDQAVPRDVSTGLLLYYSLDPASIEVAKQVKWSEGHQQILDLCAAPGGKTFVILTQVNAEALEQFIANEPNVDRRERLTKVIQNYVPQDLRKKVWVKGKPGAAWGRFAPESFDSILVDAPCSGERHQMRGATGESDWSEGRSQRLAEKQLQLLQSARQALKEGGRLVYSTCSLSPYENDEVIKKLLKQQADLQIEESSSKLGVPTDFGRIVLPDTDQGAGPMYHAILRKA